MIDDVCARRCRQQRNVIHQRLDQRPQVKQASFQMHAIFSFNMRIFFKYFLY